MLTRPALALALAALVALTACGDPGDGSSEPVAAPTVTATEEPAPTATGTTPTEAPTQSAEPSPTEVPPSEVPSTEPSDAASACTGNEQNQEFFASVAAAVDWPVLCLAEDGWVVTTGSYSLRNGGRLEIGYRGPGDATLDFREGYICEGEGCAPQGTVLGDVTLGAQGNAQLIQLEGDSFAVVADPDANPSWILVSSGLSGDALTDIAAGFATVGS